MRYGIGVITTGDRELRSEYTQYAEPGTLVHIHVDRDRIGPARSRNAVLKTLYDAGCDFITLFDDDAWPRRPGWQAICAGAMADHCIDFVGAVDCTSDIAISVNKLSPVFAGIIGQAMHLTRKCVETVGYFDTSFGVYGCEDTDYGWRAMRQGLTGQDGITVPLCFIQLIHHDDMCGTSKGSVVRDDVKATGIEKSQALFHAKWAADDFGYIGCQQ